MLVQGASALTFAAQRSDSGDSDGTAGGRQRHTMCSKTRQISYCSRLASLSWEDTAQRADRDDAAGGLWEAHHVLEDEEDLVLLADDLLQLDERGVLQLPQRQDLAQPQRLVPAVKLALHLLHGHLAHDTDAT